jgi:hypothetical protein
MFSFAFHLWANAHFRKLSDFAPRSSRRQSGWSHIGKPPTFAWLILGGLLPGIWNASDWETCNLFLAGF